jgi:predicted RNA-binding Zn-ribbon protein involved in translation (DUF1610 family)
MTTLTSIVSQHIQQHWKDHTCPLCGANEWTVNGPFALVPVTVGTDGYVNGHRTDDTASPVVAMVCRKCGHTGLVDYNVMIGREP